MARRYFGTDGIRGQVGTPPMTVDFALRLASAAARVLAPRGGTVLIGKDTRVSGYMFESALEAGFVAAGVDVLLTGPLPTPGIAYLTKKFGADFGIVISASHNPYYDNGIKFFDAEGEKLSDDARGSHRGVPRRAADHARLARARSGQDGRVGAQRLHGVLQRHDSPRYGLRRLQDRRRRVARRGIQSRAARDVGSRCRRHCRRLLTERPQHQRRLRLHAARFVEAHGHRCASARGHGARWRRRSHRDGRRARQPDRWRSAAVCPRARSLQRRCVARSSGRHRHEQSRSRGRTERSRSRVPTREGRRPPRARHVEGVRWSDRRRNIRSRDLPRPHHDRRRRGYGPAGSGRHAAHGPIAQRARVRYGPVPPGALERQSPATGRSHAGPGDSRGASTRSSPSSARAVASCFGHRAPSP